MAVYGDRVDAFEARAKAERAQRSNAAWLEELADDTAGLSASERSRRAMRRGPARDIDAAAERRERNLHRDACANDDDGRTTSAGRWLGTSNTALFHPFP